MPLGSEVEVTIEIDVSRTAKTKAFIPILDEEFEGVFKSGVITKSPDALRQELAGEVRRLEALKEKAEEVGDQKAKVALDRLEGEQVVNTVQRQVAAAQGDPDARGEADRKLLDLKAAVDTVESALEWPGLVQEAHRQLDSTREVVEAHGQPEEKQRLQGLADDIERAIDEERVELLRTRVDDVRDLGARIVVRQPGFWVGYLDYLQQRRSHMRDQAASDRLFTQAQRAINSNDIEALKAAVRQLIALLPPDEQEAAEARGGFGGTIISQ